MPILLTNTEETPILTADGYPLIGVCEITESWQDMLKRFPEKPYGLNEIKSDKRKQEWLAVRLLLKHLAGPDKYIIYKENGAPALQNSPLNISISHTTGYAAIILSKNQNPGIDIEYLSGRAWKLREKFLGEDELRMLIPSDEKSGSNTNISTICWCAKETAFKALQQTGVDFIEHLHIEPFALSKKGVLKLKETKTPQQQTFDINYQIAENYIITWKE